MPVININEIKATEIPEPCHRWIKAIMTPESQEYIKDFSITMGSIYPHRSNDLHTHEGFELLYIVTGSGKAVLGDEAIAIGPDTLIIAPPGVPHQQINDSDEMMKMFCMWSPAVSGDEVVGRAQSSNQL